ncbi:MAG: GntR family transcriptional regulator, partial [Thermoflexaceae bacterium]|nr:GntR family transcriptional regulator [Thermoflexaceae bacterium]
MEQYMNIIITNNSEVPIYEQIREQIKNMIINGELKEGEFLPSMRLLAKELRISIITTKRAYEELERDGYIESFTGKGSFVKGINPEVEREKIIYEVEELFDQILDKAETARITKEELMEIFNLLCEEKEKKNG